MQATSTSLTRFGLLSASTMNCVSQRLHTKFGERAFTLASPAALNALPADLQAPTSSSMLMLMYKLKLHKCLAVRIMKPDMINEIKKF